MDATLFQRNGSLPPKGRAIQTSEKGRAYFVQARRCGRCGGAGGAEKWAHTGWKCYDCGGSGTNGTERIPLYTAERLAKLNATKAKLDARRAAAAEARRAAEQAAADERRSAFEAAHADVLPWLREVVQFEEARQGYEPGGAEGFLPDMLRRAEKSAEWTEGQAAGVRKTKAARDAAEAARAASRHVGEVGKRITVKVTVERVHEHYRQAFNADWKTETLYIVSMRDEQGNTLVSMSTGFAPEKGAALTIKGTVAEHSDYKGEAQTKLSRVVDVAADAERKAQRKAEKQRQADYETARRIEHEMSGGLMFCHDFAKHDPDAVLVQDYRGQYSSIAAVIRRRSDAWGDAWVAFDYSDVSRATDDMMAKTWEQCCASVVPLARSCSYAGAAAATLRWLQSAPQEVAQ